MTEFYRFSGQTTVDTPANDLLEVAKLWGMEKVMVIGFDDDGDLCFGGNFSDHPLINFMLDKAKQSLLSDAEDEF